MTAIFRHTHHTIHSSPRTLHNNPENLTFMAPCIVNVFF